MSVARAGGFRWSERLSLERHLCYGLRQDAATCRRDAGAPQSHSNGIVLTGSAAILAAAFGILPNTRLWVVHEMRSCPVPSNECRWGGRLSLERAAFAGAAPVLWIAAGCRNLPAGRRRSPLRTIPPSANMRSPPNPSERGEGGQFGPQMLHGFIGGISLDHHQIAGIGRGQG